MRMTLTSLFLCLGLTACQSPGASVSELAIEKIDQKSQQSRADAPELLAAQVKKLEPPAKVPENAEQISQSTTMTGGAANAAQDLVEAERQTTEALVSATSAPRTPRRTWRKQKHCSKTRYYSGNSLRVKFPSLSASRPPRATPKALLPV